MANEITIINGVTKRERAGLGIFLYDFPNAFIEVNQPSNIYTTTIINDPSNPVQTNYDDITDKLGSADIVEYVDILAQTGYYFGNGNPTIIENLFEGELLSFTDQTATTTAAVMTFQTNLNLKNISVSNSEITFLKAGLITAFLEVNLQAVAGNRNLEIWIEFFNGSIWVPEPNSGATYDLNNSIEGGRAYVFQAPVLENTTYRVMCAAPIGDIILKSEALVTEPSVSIASKKLRLR